MGNNTHPGSKDAVAADRPAFEPPRPRRSRPARTATLAFVAIMLALYAFLRVFMLLNNENLPAGNNTLPMSPDHAEQVLQPLGELERDLN